MSEELRVLYVACTRAMNRLVLMGSVPGPAMGARSGAEPGPRGIQLLFGCDPAAALICPGATAVKPQAAQGRGSGERPICRGRGCAAPQEQAGQEVDIQDVVQALLSGERDGLNPERAERRLFWRYPYAQAVSSRSSSRPRA